ncbi:MAG: class I SAM-dependent RNA methyltransferase [Myxococcales bacterium]|nr:class I SAM-dependent RNA methyltransferase [Myxococcales bacterium]
MSAPMQEVVRIHGVAHGGQGVGRGEGPDADPRVWLVDGALPGERVAAARLREAKQMIRGEALEILEPAPTRVTPPCPHASVCGGCSWQHVDPAAQIELKREIVNGQLRHLDVEVRRAVASPKVLGYRRRARLHYSKESGALNLGFRRSRSHAIVDLDRCPVLDEPLNHAIAKVRALVDFLPAVGEIVGLSDGARAILGLPGVPPSEAIDAVIRETVLDEVLVGVALRGRRQRHSVGVTSMAIDGGGGTIAMAAGPFVFTQAQAEQNELLVRHVIEAARPRDKKVLELFAGAGNFTRALARNAAGVWALDDSRESISYLRLLAEEWQLPINAKHGKAENLLPKLARGAQGYDVAVLDPPRRGLGSRGCKALAKVVGERIVYVSCDPATLARDLRALVDSGFRISDVSIFDFMPMTPDIEVVATLEAV